MKNYLLKTLLLPVLCLMSHPVFSQETSGTADGQQKTEPPSKGHFIISGAIYLPVYGNSYDKCGYEELKFGYSFLGGSYNAGVTLGHLAYRNGSIHSSLDKYNAGTVMAYLSYGISTKLEKFSLYPTIEAGVAYGYIDRVQKQTRLAGSIGMTFMYRPVEWLRTGIDLKYLGFSNSDSSWLMLGIKLGFEF